MKKTDVIVIALAILFGIIVYSVLDYKIKMKKLELDKELKNKEILQNMMDVSPDILELGNEQLIFVKDFNYLNESYNVTYSFFKYKNGDLIKLKYEY